jgi:hypothetical protein
MGNLFVINASAALRAGWPNMAAERQIRKGERVAPPSEMSVSS